MNDNHGRGNAGGIPAVIDWHTPLSTVGGGEDKRSPNDSLGSMSFQNLRAELADWLSRNATYADSNVNNANSLVDWQTPSGTKKREAPLSAAALDGPRTKKPSGMPKRPLSAYNYFFQEERGRLMEQGQVIDEPNILPSGTIAFEELAKNIGKRWRSLPQQEKMRFHDLASRDDERCQREMEVWERKQMNPKANEKSSPKAVAELEVTQAKEVDQANPANEKVSAPSIPSLSLSVSGSDMNLMAAQAMLDMTTDAPQVPQAASAASVHSPSAEPAAIIPPFPDTSTGQNGVFAPHRSHQHASSAPLPNLLCNKQGAPGFTLTGLTRQGQDPAPKALPVAPCMEVTMPDQNGVVCRYKVQYSCYLVTQDQAKQFVKEIGDCPLCVGPSPMKEELAP